MKITIVSHKTGSYNLNKGEGYISFLLDEGKRSMIFWYCCHHCGEYVLVKDHKIEQEPDGAITISPSLVCPIEGCSGHYFIRNSEIIEA